MASPSIKVNIRNKIQITDGTGKIIKIGNLQKTKSIFNETTRIREANHVKIKQLDTSTTAKQIWTVSGNPGFGTSSGYPMVVAVKSSVFGYLCWQSGSNDIDSSTIHLYPGVWLIFGGNPTNITTTNMGTGETRCTDIENHVKYLYFKSLNAADLADIEIFTACN